MSEAKSPEPAAKQTAADKLADPAAGGADAAGSTPRISPQRRRADRTRHSRKKASAQRLTTGVGGVPHDARG